MTNFKQQLFGFALAGFLFLGGGAASASPLSVDMDVPGASGIEVQQIMHHVPHNIRHLPPNPRFNPNHAPHIRPHIRQDIRRDTHFNRDLNRGGPRFGRGHIHRRY